MKITFFGTGKFIKPVREVLANNFELVEDYKLSDLIVVASYGKILNSEVLNTPKYGAINIHPSDLPKYRGSSPIQSQILDGIFESKVTFIKMDEKLDHGPILGKVNFEILDTDTFESAVFKAFDLASKNIVDVIERYINKQIEPIFQDDLQASFTKILKKEDGFINLENLPSQELLERMIRAYFPWPGVWTKFKFNTEEKIIKLIPNKMIQVEGKTKMSFKDFINGYQNGREVVSKLGL